MKEFALKHPILTFLLADALICGVFNTIRSFAPKKTASTCGCEVTVEDPDKEEEAE
jgi:hypothetical protein